MPASSLVLRKGVVFISLPKGSLTTAWNLSSFCAIYKLLALPNTGFSESRTELRPGSEFFLELPQECCIVVHQAHGLSQPLDVDIFVPDPKQAPTPLALLAAADIAAVFHPQIASALQRDTLSTPRRVADIATAWQLGSLTAWYGAAHPKRCVQLLRRFVPLRFLESSNLTSYKTSFDDSHDLGLLPRASLADVDDGGRGSPWIQFAQGAGVSSAVALLEQCLVDFHAQYGYQLGLNFCMRLDPDLLSCQQYIISIVSQFEKLKSDEDFFEAAIKQYLERRNPNDVAMQIDSKDSELPHLGPFTCEIVVVDKIMQVAVKLDPNVDRGVKYDGLRFAIAPVPSIVFHVASVLHSRAQGFSLKQSCRVLERLMKIEWTRVSNLY
eukprot:TRINITY_DN12531_c8_g1_i1.p2 TRINITY_DN12531_c8_g1~~TRINITY_DN12531_c8_g1_i1.p2  ORF type:complete len:382 (+),score=33.03 TRINITY_DN12531_c8_g1_i1:1217-2362(+)